MGKGECGQLNPVQRTGDQARVVKITAIKKKNEREKCSKKLARTWVGDGENKKMAQIHRIWLENNTHNIKHL